MKIKRFFQRALNQLKNGWRSKEWWRFKMPSLIIRGIFAVIHLSNNGFFVAKEDWDNLIILDACGYEVFEKTNWIKGSLEKKTSRGSHTMMFLNNNFKGYSSDIIYISSNPFIWDFKDNFFKVVYIGSILPETLAHYATITARSYPNKRLIVHFVQPHHPFIGETKIAEADEKNIDPYHLFAEGKVSRELIFRAYQDNLKRVLKVTEQLIQELPGKTVVSADHGEAFGAKIPYWPFKIYAHSGPRIKELTDIPWFLPEVVKERKKILLNGKKEKSIIIDENEIRNSL